MKKDISHQEQLQNYLRAAGAAGNAAPNSDGGALAEIAAVAPSVGIANLYLEALAQVDEGPLCTFCQELATVELPIKEFDFDAGTVKGPWLACEQCHGLITHRSLRKLVEIGVSGSSISAESQPLLAKTLKYFLKKLFASLTGEVRLVGDSPSESPWGLPPATLRESDLLPWNLVRRQMERTSGKPGVNVMPTFAIGRPGSGKSGVFRTYSVVLRGEDLSVVGFLTIYPFGSPNGKNLGEYEIYVDPNCRRMGLGMHLLRIADEEFGLDFTVQHYTVAGRALAHSYLQDRDLTVAATA